MAAGSTSLTKSVRRRAGHATESVTLEGVVLTIVAHILLTEYRSWFKLPKEATQTAGVTAIEVVGRIIFLCVQSCCVLILSMFRLRKAPANPATFTAFCKARFNSSSRQFPPISPRLIV